MSSTAAETSQLGVSNQLASLVPTFDPSRDDLVTYQQKVELVTAAWPKTKLAELQTRLILNTTGSAFQKLQIHQAELVTGEEAAIKKLVELLGGQWGRVPLAKKYEEAEIALFHTQQHSDETNDSYLARADVNWSKLLAQKVTLADLQAFITLRGSCLTAEDKKRIVLESEAAGQLTTKRVAESIRMLGSVFFNDITGNKRTVKSKVYDQTALIADASHDGEDSEPVFNAEDAMNEEEVLEMLLQEGDSDALLVHDFESALSETVQEDPELASAYSAYQIARHKLNEKARNRGFFPSRPFQPSQSKGKGFGSRNSFKGKGFSSFNRPRRSLQDRILSSNCRACGQKGHWKAECPLRQNQQNAGSASSQAPTGTVVTESSLETMDSLPLEFLQLPRSDEAAIDEATLSEPSQVFVCQATSSRPRLYYRGRILGESRGISIGPLGENNNIKSLKERLRMTVLRKDDEPMSTVLSPHVQVSPSSPKTERSDRPVNVPGHPVMHSKVEVPCHTPSDDSSEVSVNPVCFATHTTFGVLDLGASKTVIGSDHVKSLICSLDQPIRERLTRCKCQITFRFGNQGTLTSNQAIVVPIGNLLLKIAVVPGSTPFLISNTLMRALQAQIDCQAFLLRSPKLRQPVRMELTNKGLFLIDLNELARASNCPLNEHPAAKTVGETFTATTCKREIPAESDSDCKGSRDSPVSSPMQCLSESQGLNQEIRACSVMPDEQDFNSHAAVGDSPAQAQHTSDCVKTEHQDPKSHVPESALEGFADEVRTKPIRCSSSEHPRPRERDGGLREEKLRPQLHGGVEHRPRMGSIHGRPLQQEPQSSPPEVPSIRGTHGSTSRGATDACGGPDGPRIDRGFWPCRQPTKGQGQREVPAQGKGGCGSEFWLPGANPFSVVGRRTARGDRDVQLTDYGTISPEPKPGIQCHAGAPAESRECSDQSGQSPGNPGHGASEPEPGNAVDPPSIAQDDVSEAFTAVHHDMNHLNRWIKVLEHELNNTLNTTKPMGKPFMLGEIFLRCGVNPDSPGPTVGPSGISFWSGRW